MSREKREWKKELCPVCGNPFVKKPVYKKTCSDRCRYKLYNQRRGRVTKRTATEYLETVLMPASEAAISMGKSYEQVRTMIRRGEIRAQRLFGRILIHRGDVEARI